MGRQTVRKKRKSGHRAVSRFFWVSVAFCAIVMAVLAVFQGFCPIGGKQGGKETAGQGLVQEPGAAQKEETQGPKPSRMEPAPNDGNQQENQVATQGLSFADVHAMAAGSILDVSSLPQQELGSFFYSEELPWEVQQRILGSSYQENDNISLPELRYLRVLHMGFDGKTYIGELIVNQSIAEDILEIMSQLYAQAYPIEKMVLIDAYGADDERSMSDNNTSAFNYREIAGSSKLSKHALGLAIDINPKYNPYVKDSGTGELDISPANGAGYADRDGDFPYKIAEGDLCLQLFLEHGFAWGGNWNSVKDYQHFEK